MRRMSCWIATALPCAWPTTNGTIAKRLANAKGELEHRNWYRYWLLNDDREQARADLKAIFRAEELRRERWSAPPVGG